MRLSLNKRQRIERFFTATADQTTCQATKIVNHLTHHSTKAQSEKVLRFLSFDVGPVVPRPSTTRFLTRDSQSPKEFIHCAALHAFHIHT